MKTKLLLAALYFSFQGLIFAQCPAAGYTCIPDSNFEQALIDQGIDSEGGPADGRVLTVDISDETLLNIQSKGISDLTGIEDFTSLERLLCNQNSLTSLDLSNNMALTQVNCYFNTSLTSLILPDTNTLTHIEFYNCNLSSIDLSPYTNLDLLRSYNNPSLGNLVLTNNTSLRILFCYNNGLSSLDVSNNPLLETLDCYNNNISTLDVNNNTSLTRLWCHQNDLSSLDVTQNTALTTLYCYSNQLQNNLDVSNNDLLDRLWCHDNMLTSLTLPVTNTLTNFRCWGNNLTTLDAGGLGGLQFFNCSENQLTSLIHPVTPTLQDLRIFTNNLTSFDPTGLTGLTYLDCGINAITSLDVSNLVLLEQLYCNQNDLAFLDMKNNNNANLDFVWAQDNTNLMCIQVDDVSLANTNTTNGDWQKDMTASYSTSCPPLSIEEFNLSSISIFPNPTIDIFEIDLIGKANYQLFNIQGQEVLRGSFTQGLNKLNASSISSGLYVLKLKNDAGSVSKKLIKN